MINLTSQNGARCAEKYNWKDSIAEMDKYSKISIRKLKIFIYFIYSERKISQKTWPFFPPLKLQKTPCHNSGRKKERKTSTVFPEKLFSSLLFVIIIVFNFFGPRFFNNEEIVSSPGAKETGQWKIPFCVPFFIFLLIPDYYITRNIRFSLEYIKYCIYSRDFFAFGTSSIFFWSVLSLMKFSGLSFSVRFCSTYAFGPPFFSFYFILFFSFQCLLVVLKFRTTRKDRFRAKPEPTERANPWNFTVYRTGVSQLFSFMK